MNPAESKEPIQNKLRMRFVRIFTQFLRMNTRRRIWDHVQSTLPSGTPIPGSWALTPSWELVHLMRAQLTGDGSQLQLHHHLIHRIPTNNTPLSALDSGSLARHTTTSMLACLLALTTLVGGLPSTSSKHSRLKTNSNSNSRKRWWDRKRRCRLKWLSSNSNKWTCSTRPTAPIKACSSSTWTWASMETTNSGTTLAIPLWCDDEYWR